jgi:hypothetical protein
MNWLADSKPSFPADFSEIVYAQIYAKRGGALVSSRRPTLRRANPLSVRASHSSPIRSPFPRYWLIPQKAAAQPAQLRARAAEVRFRRAQQLSGSGRRRGRRNRSHDWENTRILSP